jgi:ribonuclease PH
MRPNGRTVDQLREITFQSGFVRNASGSVLTRCGATTVLCTCMVEDSVPPFLDGKGTGWLTAEYGMLPGSTNTRKQRDKAGKVDGRSVEIQRLIGRSLRAIVNLDKLGERTLWLDCDVIEADGGTRTTAINGAYVALILALRKVREKLALPPIEEIVTDSVAAISVGICDGEVRLDLEYVEDRDAAVDMNLVMTGSNRFIEVQGTGEEATYTRAELDQLLALGEKGIREITAMQMQALAS